MIIDLYNDTAHGHLNPLLQKYPKAHERVKTAQISYEYNSALPKTAFAWETERKFPIDTPENAIVSQLYVSDVNSAEEIPSFVSEKIAVALKIYGVPEDTFDANMEKVAHEEEKWLLVSKKRFKVEDAETVKTAEEVLMERYPELELEEREEAFSNLYKYANEYGVELSPASHQLGSFTLTSTQQLRDSISARHVMAEEGLFKAAYFNLEQGLKEGNQLIYKDDEQELLKNTLVDLDKKAGLDKEWGKKIIDPQLSVYNLEEKKAEVIEFDENVLLSRDKIRGIPAETWEDLLGEDITDEDGDINYDELEKILPTIPADLKASILPYVK